MTGHLAGLAAGVVLDVGPNGHRRPLWEVTPLRWHHKRSNGVVVHPLIAAAHDAPFSMPACRLGRALSLRNRACMLAAGEERTHRKRRSGPCVATLAGAVPGLWSCLPPRAPAAASEGHLAFLHMHVCPINAPRL